LSDVKVKSKQIEDLYFDKAFQNLIKSTERFNMFRVMGVDKKERPHSEILSYFLDPGNNHSLEKRFLKKFLVLLKNNEGISFNDYLNMIKENLRAVETEKYLGLNNIIDLFIEFNSLVIGIENKVDAGESKDQLKQYQQILKEKYKGKNKLIVFLTPSGRDPDSSDSEIGVKIISISYEDIKNICEEIKENAHDNIRMFLDNFIIHLEEDIMGSSNEINQICRKIHENHPEAYRYLVEHHQTIINDKIIRLFEKLKEEINEIPEPGLIINEFGVEEISKDLIRTEIRIRNEEWPEGFFIIIYKHSKFGIYPCVIEEVLNDKLKKLINDIFDTEVKGLPAPYKKNKFYFTSDYVNSTASYRAIKEDGDYITEKDIKEAKKRMLEIYKSINSDLLEINKRL